MEYRPLDITIMSAEGLKNVNIFMKMGVFVVVSLNDDSISKKKTHISYSGSNPKWNHRIKITLEESSISDKSLLFQIKCSRILGDRDIGEVIIPLRELLDGVGTVDKTGDNVVTYTVRTPTGKCKGNLKFSYKFGENFVQRGETVHKRNKSDGSVRNNVDESNIGDGSVKIYTESNVTYQPPPGGMIYALPQYPHAGYPTAQGYHGYHVYPPQQYGGEYNNVYPPTPHGSGGCSGAQGYHGYHVYPPQQYGGEYNVYPPTPHGSGGCSGEFPRYPPNGGYLYPPQQVGHGYSGKYSNQAQVEQPNNQKMGNATKLGLGLGTGLIGGVLVGEMISDIGNTAAAGCNANLENAITVADD